MPNPHRNPALQQLREMILRGAFSPGERLTEAALAERLGISRMPVRQALPALSQEGLLVPVGKRGYAVREFTQQESIDALTLRAAVEGLAARSVAERGASPELLAALNDCLKAGDALFAKRHLGEEEVALYGEMNGEFHALILHAADQPILTETIARCLLVPFVRPSRVVFSERSKTLAFDDLFCAHGQHHAIVDAIVARDGARAELIFREHAHVQRRSMSF